MLLPLAARNLGRHRLRNLLSVLVLGLGVSSLVTMRGMINGVQRANQSMFVDATYGALQVHRAGYFEVIDASPLTLDFADTEALRGRLLAVPGVRALSPRIHFGAMLSLPDAPDRPGKFTHLQVTAIDPLLERAALPRRVEWATAWPGSSQAPALVLDRQLATALQLPERTADETPEDQWPALLATDREEALNGIAVRLTGLLGSGLPGDRRVGLVTLGPAQSLLRMPGRITEYALALQPGASLPGVQAAVQAALGPGYEVHRWNQLMPFLEEVDRGQDVFALVLSLIVTVVVLLVVANAQLMTVMDRGREVGTMMALGLRRRQIAGLFATEAALLGGLGGGLGMAVGAQVVASLAAADLRLAAPGAELASPIVPTVTAGWLLFCLLLAVLGSVGAALWASRSAAARSPAEALREP